MSLFSTLRRIRHLLDSKVISAVYSLSVTMLQIPVLVQFSMENAIRLPSYAKTSCSLNRTFCLFCFEMMLQTPRSYKKRISQIHIPQLSTETLLSNIAVSPSFEVKNCGVRDDSWDVKTDPIRVEIIIKFFIIVSSTTTSNCKRVLGEGDNTLAPHLQFQKFVIVVFLRVYLELKSNLTFLHQKQSRF